MFHRQRSKRINVKVNFDALAEGLPLEIDQPKDKAKNFLIATGDGIMVHEAEGNTIESTEMLK